MVWREFGDEVNYSASSAAAAGADDDDDDDAETVRSCLERSGGRVFQKQKGQYWISKGGSCSFFLSFSFSLLLWETTLVGNKIIFLCSLEFNFLVNENEQMPTYEQSLSRTMPKHCHSWSPMPSLFQANDYINKHSGHKRY